MCVAVKQTTMFDIWEVFVCEVLQGCVGRLHLSTEQQHTRTMNTTKERQTATGHTVSEHLAHIFTHLNGEGDLAFLMFLDDLSAQVDSYTTTHRTDKGAGILFAGIRAARQDVNRELNAAGLNEQG